LQTFYDYSGMSSPLAKQLITFLLEDLHLSESAIAMALREPFLLPNQLPIVLWQLGLVTLEQVDEIFSWLENASVETSEPV
jgi:hypothetical protein